MYLILKCSIINITFTYDDMIVRKIQKKYDCSQLVLNKIKKLKYVWLIKSVLIIALTFFFLSFYKLSTSVDNDIKKIQILFYFYFFEIGRAKIERLENIFKTKEKKSEFGVKDLKLFDMILLAKGK